MSFRRRQRSRQHHEAHRDETTSLPPPLDHPLVPRGEAELITETARLADFVAHARTEESFAFDTEFIGEATYLPKTCLIQLATSERVALVDPFRIDDLSAVWELVAEPGVITVVHAGASDLSPVRRQLAREPSSMIDVQVAAGFLGCPYPSSLAKLVERFAGFPLSKGHTFTDWDARPLTRSQLRYAADDVRYLPLVWHEIRRGLHESGRLAWAEAETAARLEDPHIFDVKGHARRASRGFELDADQSSLLEALCVARDAIAQAENLPHRAAIADGSLLEMVRSRPETRAALLEVRGLPRPIISRHGDLLAETVRANPSTPATWFAVRRRREDEPEAKAAIDRMLAAAHRRSEELGIAPTLSVTRGDLERFMRRVLAALDRGDAPPALFDEGDWRRAAFADVIERAMYAART